MICLHIVGLEVCMMINNFKTGMHGNNNNSQMPFTGAYTGHLYS